MRRISRYSGGRGSRRCGVLWGTAGGAHQVVIIATIVSMVVAELGEVLHVRKLCVCDHTANPGFVLCLVVLDGGWAFPASLEGDKIVDHHMSIITRAASVY